MRFKQAATALFTGLGLFSISATSLAQSDNAGNYGGGWTNGANGGTGFGPWAIVSTNGTNFFSGNFIGDPNAAGISGFGTTAFGFYANPNNSPAFVQADRSFPALTNGKTFSLKWAINFDSGAGGNKGFNLYTGGTNKIQILNVNNGGSEAITLDGVNVGFGYGTTPMTWTFSQISSNTIRVAANDRDGSGNFAANVTVNGPADSFRIYASAMQAGDSAQPYFNDFAISNTPAGLDTNPPTIALAAGVDKVTWVALNGTVNLSTNDVTAADAEGVVSVSISPSTVVTTNNSPTTITYTATDAAGYRSSITRVVAVGNAAPGYHNLRGPASMTLNTSSSDSAYGEIYLDGATPGAGAASGIQAWIGVNTNNSDPATWTDSVWSTASYVGEEGNNDNFQGTISGTNREIGTYYYATRFRLGANSSNTNFFYGGIGNDGVSGTWGVVRTNQVVSTNVVSGVTNVVTNSVAVTNGNGVLTVLPVRNVTFAVDMGVQIFMGRFDPATHGLEVRGDFNGFNGSPLVRQGTSTVYTNTFAINGTNGAVQRYKFFANGTNSLAWEELPDNRSFTLGTSDQTLPTEFFSGLTESRKIVLSVDMSEQVANGKFNPLVHTVSVNSSLDWSAFTPLAPAPALGTYVYSLDYFSGGLLSFFPETVEYKFVNSAPGLPDGGYEGGANRTFSKSAVNASNLSTTTIPLATFVDVPGATFAGWSGGGIATNSQTVGKYAIGGATNISAASEAPVTLVDSNKLSLSAIVRTNDSKLTVVGEAGGSLTNWNTNGVSVTVSGNTNGVPEGHQRQLFSVDRGSDSRKFLRLKATLAP